jgi:hypothetical protein
MKTPMQELLDKINNEEFDHLDDCKMFIQEYMLEKEKEMMCEFQDKAQFRDFWVKYEGSEDCFDKTFKTKEK